MIKTIPLLRIGLVSLGFFLLFGPTSSQATQACPSYKQATVRGHVETGDLTEASGLAVSRSQTNLLWTHNDSGNPAVLFALSGNGALRSAYTLTGTSNRDWEDIAVGPGPSPNQDYVYIGDIGDNNRVRSSITIYRVPEPMVPTSPVSNPLPLSDAVALTFTYPDQAHDAETLMVDPNNGDLYLLTKNRSGGKSRLYRAPFPQSPSSPTPLEFLFEIDFSGSLSQRLITGGDISSNGQSIIVRSYTQAHLWQRADGESISSALGKSPCTLPLSSEPQGEAIAFESHGANFLTLSERVGQPLYEYEQIPTVSLLGSVGSTLAMTCLTFLGLNRKTRRSSNPVRKMARNRIF